MDTQGVPKGPQEVPKGGQGVPKGPPGISKECPRGPPGVPKGSPKDPQGSDRDDQKAYPTQKHYSIRGRWNDGVAPKSAAPARVLDSGQSPA